MKPISQSSSSNRRSKSWRFWLGLLLSIISIVWLIYTINWSETWAVLGNTNYSLVFVAIIFNLSSIPIRTLRWQLMFPPKMKPPFIRLTGIMLIGQAVNVIMPARLGDLLRATLVTTARPAYVLGTLFVQSSLDLLMVAVLTIALLFQLTLPAWWYGSGQILILTTGGILLATVIVILNQSLILRLLTAFAKRWPRWGGDRLLALATHFLNSLQVFQNPAKLLGAIAYSALIWIIYAAVNWILLLAIGQTASWLIAFFLLVTLQLSIAVPSSPGRLGVFHYLCVQALALFAIGETEAISYAIILHLISIVMPIILGVGISWAMAVEISTDVESPMGVEISTDPQKVEA